ncbi:MAG: dephospho-CoA kinase [Gammaproteobacteria bacterium]|nr:dephospho-CoA kinase [Gammaproteobacteria bacterium]
MLTIALTGGIGSGKTVVTNLFQELASQSRVDCELTIIDADVIARNLLAGSLKEPYSSIALQEVKNLFGSDLFNSDGFLDRTQLRSLIFSSEEKKQQLEALLHPLVYDEIFTQITEIHSGIIIVSIPLFFETNAPTKVQTDNNVKSKFDRILVVDVPVKLQIERTQKRDNCQPDLVKKIIHSQVDRKVRLKYADDIIENIGNTLDLQLKVQSLLNMYYSLENNE